MQYLVTFEDGSNGYLEHAVLTDSEVERRHYAFPDERRFPLTDRDKVLSAIRFFNYAKPDEEETLAKAILKRMEELGMKDVNVGPDNRFGKYYKQAVQHGGYLAHHGIKGMKWGVRNAETQAKYAGGSNRQIAKAAKAEWRNDVRKARAARAKDKANGVKLVTRNARYVGAMNNARYKRDVKAYGADKKNAKGKKYSKNEYIYDRYSVGMSPTSTRTKARMIAKGHGKLSSNAAAIGKDVAIGTLLSVGTVGAMMLAKPAGRKLIKLGATKAQLYMRHTVNQAKVAQATSRSVRYATKAGIGRARNRARGVRYVSGMGLA